MAYRVMTEETLPAYLRTRDALKEKISDKDDLSVCEVGDGNLNQVFLVRDLADPHRSMVVKQALPYLRVAGESWPLTRERMRFESQALRLYNELCPGLAPEVYDDDGEMSLIIMEYLGAHQVMRKSLVERLRFPRFVEHITTFLSTILFRTSDFALPGAKKKEMLSRYINPHLNKLQEDFVYTNPFMASPDNKWNPLIDDEVKAIRSSSKVKIEIAEMKEAYMTHAEALIHADLHTGSIMLNQSNTRVIDPEFCFFGPIAYDVGALLQNIVLNHLSHFGHTEDREQREEYQEYLLCMVRDVWTEFARKFDSLWSDSPTGDLMPSRYWDYPGGRDAFSFHRGKTLKRLLQEAAGHGGTKFLRRMMGIVNVWDIESIDNPEKRAVAEKAAIRIGSRWLLERRTFQAIDDLTGIVKEETKCISF
jgi:5-methylthioribose kinase